MQRTAGIDLVLVRLGPARSREPVVPVFLLGSMGVPCRSSAGSVLGRAPSGDGRVARRVAPLGSVRASVSEVGEPVGRAAKVLSALSPESMLEAFDASQVFVTITEGPRHRLVWRNRAAVSAFGPLEVGAALFDLLPESRDLQPLWDRAFGGASVVVPTRRIRRSDVAGEHRVMRYSISPLRDREGMPVGVIQFVTDATAEADAEAEATRSRMQAAVAVAVSGAVDAVSALRALADALVPELADLAAVYVFANTGELVTSGETIPPLVLSVSDVLRRAGDPPLAMDRDEPSRWGAVLAAGSSIVIPVDAGLLAELRDDVVMTSWLTKAQASSFAAAPLMIAGEIAGAVVVMSAGARPPYGDADLSLLDEVTSRAGAAISEVRARARSHRVAARLQAVLLPGDPPQLAGLETAARYVPGGKEDPVGGDWWDVVDLGDGCVGLGVGDISGHGIASAALMGQARIAMRVAGQAHLSPGELLGLLDRHVAEAVDREWHDGEEDTQFFATALYARVEPGARCLRIASAGHLPVLRRPACGPTEIVWAPSGPPLGLGMGRYQESVVAFGPGDLAVFYTDGLVEERGAVLTDGIDRLAAALGRAPVDAPLQALVDLLLAEMKRSTSPEDDVALLIARPRVPFPSALRAGQVG